MKIRLQLILLFLNYVVIINDYLQTQKVVHELMSFRIQEIIVHLETEYDFSFLNRNYQKNNNFVILLELFFIHLF
jgi:hypothetical protein